MDGCIWIEKCGARLANCTANEEADVGSRDYPILSTEEDDV